MVLSRYPEAIRAASRALELNPNSLLALRLRASARSYAEEGEGDDAVALIKADLRGMIDVSPEEPLYRREFVNYLMDRSDFSEAISLLDESIEACPNEVWFFYARGSCRTRLDEEFWEKDIDESGEERVERSKAAIVDIERAIELGMRDEDTYWELVRAYEGLHDAEAMLAVLDRAVEALPSFSLLYVFRESRRRNAGDLKGAAEDHARAEALGYRFDP